MNTDELDAWFAKADDVLTDWHGSPDSAAWADGTADLSHQNSYAFVVPMATRTFGGLVFLEVRVDVDAINAAIRRIGEQMHQIGRIAEQVAATFPQFEWSLPRSDVRAHALAARQNRNTGPADRRRLDQRQPHRR